MQSIEVRDEHIGFIATVLSLNVPEILKLQNGNLFGTSVVDSSDRVWYVNLRSDETFVFKRFTYITRATKDMITSDTPTDMEFEIKFKV